MQKKLLRALNQRFLKKSYEKGLSINHKEQGEAAEKKPS